MTRKFITVLGATIAATICTYVIAVMLVSQLNIARIEKLGFSVSFTERLHASLYDLVGMLGIYLPVILAALSIAFLFTSLVLLRYINIPKMLFPLGGLAGVVAAHVIMNFVFGVAGIAPTRTIVGLLSQGLAGALGGYIYFLFVYRCYAIKK